MIGSHDTIRESGIGYLPEHGATSVLSVCMWGFWWVGGCMWFVDDAYIYACVWWWEGQGRSKVVWGEEDYV